MLVVGANDVVNPAARHDKKSPIYGMPIIDADKAKTVIAIKRSMNPGFAGIDNELYYADNTLMVFGDAKSVLGDIVKALAGDGGTLTPPIAAQASRLMQSLIDLFLHLDTHLAEFVATYGVWVYGLLFAIVFAETGLVVTPFLPGDSLLFAAGALAATGALDIWIVVLAADRGGGPRRRGELQRRALHRPARLPRRRHVGRHPQAAQPRASRSRARLLREVRRHGGRARALRADRPHVRAVRGRRGRDDAIRRSSFYNVAGGVAVGGVVRRGRATRSATCRSSRTTSRSWRWASSRCRCCRWSSSSSATGGSNAGKKKGRAEARPPIMSGRPVGRPCPSTLYARRTFSARGPFGPWPLSNVTAWPSRRLSNWTPLHADWWKKYSLPSLAATKPKPLSLTSRLIVPFVEAISNLLCANVTVRCRARNVFRAIVLAGRRVLHGSAQPISLGNSFVRSGADTRDVGSSDRLRKA